MKQIRHSITFTIFLVPCFGFCQKLEAAKESLNVSPPGLIQQDDRPDDPSRFSLRNGKSGRIAEQTFERVLERKNLEHLELEACRIDDADLERIGRLTKLRTLRLHRNDIVGTGLNHLANLQSLEVLDLSASRITDVGFSDLKSLPKLKQLVIGNSQITAASLETIAQFESLEKLVIPRACCVDGIAKLKRLNNLQSIQFEGSSTGGERSNLANAFELLVHHQGRSAEQAFRVLFPARDVEESALVTTVLFNNHNFNLPNVDDRMIQFLSQMKHLQSLALIHSGVSDDGFKTYEFPSTLTRLTLAGISVSDATMKRIGTCTSLTHLDIHSAEDDSLVHLANLTRLQTLGLSGPIGPEGLAHLSKLSNLASLSLSSTRIGNADIKMLQKLPALERLNLSRLKIGDEAMKAIGAMPKLTELTLAQTNLTDAGLTDIGKLTNLQILNLNETMITDAGLRNLSNLSFLKEVCTSGTAVTCGGRIKFYQEAMGQDPIAILEREGVSVFKDIDDNICLKFIGRTDRSFQPEHFSLASQIDGVKQIRIFRVSATDDCLEIISGLSGLECLYCYRCKQLGDRGLAAIAKIDSLRQLTLIGSDDVTDAGIAKLAKLTRIESLNLRLGNVSDEALEKLRVALPKCNITWR